MSRYAVLRLPCLQEDEGRTTYIDSFDTKEQAQAWIDAQKNKYFKPGDYTIAKGEN